MNSSPTGVPAKKTRSFQKLTKSILKPKLEKNTSFRAAAKKMQEHYGIDVPESSIRAITLGHASCMQEESINSLENCLGSTGEAARFVGEMDGSMIPVVLIDEDAEGDKRKTRKTEWQEAKLCQVYKLGSTDKRHQATMGGPDEAGDRWLSCAIAQSFNQQSTIHCVMERKARQRISQSVIGISGIVQASSTML